MTTSLLEAPRRATVLPASPPPPPAVLGDRLVRLAQDADRAGYRIAAEHLAYLAARMLETPEQLQGGH